jgi:hypothetical protein
LKASLNMNKKVGILHNRTFLPWHFFVVNDDNKCNPTFFQTMHCTIFHYIS